MTYPTGPKSDYEAQALSRLLEQYKNKPVLAALLESYSRRIQELENATWEVITLRLLDQAEGYQLETIGKIVGVYKGSLTEEQFQREISVAILLLRSQGNPDKIQKIVRLILPDDVHFTYEEEAIAAIRILVTTTIDATTSAQLWRIAQRARLGGVRMMVEVPVALVPSQTFYLSDYYGAAPLETNGLADFYSSWPSGGDPGSLDNLYSSEARVTT